MSSEMLKPCPFCGGKPQLMGFNAPEFWVSCLRIGCKAGTEAFGSKDRAITVWNTRQQAEARATSGAGDAIREALKPWSDHHGPLPEYDHPAACVFDSGVQYAVELLAKELDVDDWTPCDGTEEYDGDLGGTLMNIVRAAMPKDAHGEQMWPKEVREALSASPTEAPGSEVAAINCPQISMGHGLVDVGPIEWQGRKGIILHPRDRYIPVGDPGDLAGDYWPVAGDVVVWIDKPEGASVIIAELAALASPTETPGSQGAGEDTGTAYPDNTYTPYGRRSVHNLAKELGIIDQKPTVVSVINKASDEIAFLRALTAPTRLALNEQEGG